MQRKSTYASFLQWAFPFYKFLVQLENLWTNAYNLPWDVYPHIICDACHKYVYLLRLIMLIILKKKTFEFEIIIKLCN